MRKFTVIFFIFFLVENNFSLSVNDLVNSRQEKSNDDAVSTIDNKKSRTVSFSSKVNKLNREGIALAKKGLYDSAILKFREALLIQNFSSARTYNNLAFTYEKSGRIPLAIETYKEGLIRNPNLIETLQRLSKLLYLNNKYKEAIYYANRLLTVHPKNKTVRIWLSDAKLKLKKQREEKKTSSKKRVSHIKKNKKVSQNNTSYKLLIGYHIKEVIRKPRDANVFVQHYQPGYLKIPMDIFGRYRLDNLAFVDFYLGTPYFGAVDPAFLSGEEKIEYLVKFHKAYLGAGILSSQANFDSIKMPDDSTFILNTDYSVVHDIKFGFRGGFIGTMGTADFSLYPRYLFKDAKNEGKKIEFDRVYISMKLKTHPTYILADNHFDKGFLFSFFFHFIVDELFVTEYKAGTSGENIGHYFGNYDFVFGIEVGNINPSKKKKDKLPMLFGVSLVERFNFQDLNNSDLSSILNGQGYFGLNSSTLMDGDAFSGYKSNSHIIKLYTKQLFMNFLEVGESVSAEITSSSEANYAFYLELYVSVKI